MKTESHSINDVLAKNATSFFIPPFQRAYAWGKNEIERYFSDVLRIIDSELNTKQHDKLEHFFGTVVIKEEKAGFANKSVVVDGQQRLTTTHIFHAILNATLSTRLAINKTKFTYIIPIKAMSKFIINSFSNRPSLMNNFIHIHSRHVHRHIPKNKVIMRQFRMATILSGGKIPYFFSIIMISSKNLT